MEEGQSTYYKKDDLVEHVVQIDDSDMKRMVEEYLMEHADFDFDEVELTNNRPMNIWLTARCLKYIDPDDPDPDIEADVETSKRYQHDIGQEDDAWL